MRYLVNSRKMQQYDTNTIEKLHIPGMVLMERAALTFVCEWKKQSVAHEKLLVVCGIGNNGGDGLAIARLLVQEGYEVDTVLVGDRKKSSGQNALQQEIFRAHGNAILDEIPSGDDYTTVIDAIFGVGLSREVTGSYVETIEKLNSLSGKKYAVDLASGVSAENGAILGTAFRADVTITFAYGKIGQYLFPGNEYSGKVIVTEIGIGKESWFGDPPKVAVLERNDLDWIPKRQGHSNKGTYGKVLVIAGTVNMAGAACLCGRAAYAAGCGLVRILTPEENRLVIQTALPEAILTTYDRKDLDTESLENAMDWADVIVCGPGLGRENVAGQLVEYVIKHARVPLVLDADALNEMAEKKELLSLLPKDTILTPHLGEMSRLTGKSVPEIQKQLFEVAEVFARQYNIVCVLKDEHTVTACPDGTAYLNLSGNHGMATAGSGDVLSGILGSLLAQGMETCMAAPFGVFLHGVSGDEIRGQVGSYGMMASDLIEGIRITTKKLEK